jgi:hypothetical protein
LGGRQEDEVTADKRGERELVHPKHAGAAGHDEADAFAGGKLEAERRGQLDPAVEVTLRPQQRHDLSENVHLSPVDLAY